jgi:predicted dehydrogenase
MAGRFAASRRDFLRWTAGATAAVAAPMIIPQSAFGANERIAVGFIGVGNQGGNNLRAFLKKDIAIPAVCDVDSTRIASAMNIVAERGHKAEGFTDFRRLLDRKDIDAVCATVPDHWHALVTILSCAAGKDVYCEKPLSLTIKEGRRMVDAARQHNRVVQTGSQQRSAKEFRTACELVRNGAIGKVHTVLVGIGKNNHPGPLGPDSDPPKELDYDMWLGPAPWRPYNEKRCHYNFRFWWDYSGGQMTNWGAHHLDITQWGLGTDDTGPIATEGTATFNAEKLYEVTDTFRITHTYANGVKVLVGQQQKDVPGGTTFIGDKGRIFVNRGKLTADPDDILKLADKEWPIRLAVSNDHHQNFLDCVKSREKPICDVEIGHRSATVCHLGNIVCRLGRGIQWDPKSEEIIGDTEAQAMADKAYRKPWTHRGV